MKTIEIQTGDGEVLVLPDTEQAREWIEPYIGGEGTELMCLAFGGLTDRTRFELCSGAAALWLDEAVRTCPYEFFTTCRKCDHYADCNLSADEIGERLSATDNAEDARAWGKKETT